ncbi:cupredoxin domain-containing protein [Alteromonas sp. a30]|uniref:cupredoxin domain-containing protein n=1 Tax=Alteromonas sp. a30 TaxID=2730917 RepID=UPI002280AABF|nr:cupredoxin domain-containing protein [Alteromonas sp. a30]MCY7295545.1 cupredoxin domain-containing protein [Alteromonas sp. a30]
MTRKSQRLYLLQVLLYLSTPVFAAIPEFRLTIKNNLFYPTEMQVPANVKFRLVIDNQDNEPEEFDSFDLNREKVIFGKRSATIYVGPLKPGEYHYFGEYNPNTARGKLIVVAPEAMPKEDVQKGESHVN